MEQTLELLIGESVEASLDVANLTRKLLEHFFKEFAFKNFILHFDVNVPLQRQKKERKTKRDVRGKREM